MNEISWIAASLALFATWLNIKKDKRCFYIWLITNGFWAGYDIAKGLYAQGALFTAYFVLAVYGLWRWKGEQD